MSKRRTLIKALLTLTLFLCAIGTNAENQNGKSWETLIKAISAVESGNNPKAVNGQHAGLLQISPVCVRECNNIAGYKKYTYNDRFSAEKSIEMFELIQSKYNPGRDIERAARLWNGGMGGVLHPKRTDRYYRAVKKKMNQLSAERD